ncbi:MAG: hypothetical protein CL608_01795 [Anaerolineaceae bacterium]|nr:hypothetical protein [Anaerolineaceae bacterium]
MNGRLWQKLSILLITIMLAVGCGRGAVNDAPTPTVDPAEAMQAAIQATMAAESGNRGEQIATWLAELDEAEARWAANPLENYEIEVLYVESSRQVIQIHTVTVEDGTVIAEDTRCSDQATGCVISKIPTDRLTIPGLFQTARNALENDEINEFGGGFKFHETYGFPQNISLRTTGTNALPWYWQVESFTANE